MKRRTFRAFCTVILLLALAAPAALGQTGDRTMPMRTPDGQPDVSGIFTFRTLTPLERPAQFDGVERLGPEEAAQFEASERIRRNRDLFDPEKGALFYRPRSEGGVLSYNEFWYERGIELTSDKRTSLIVDPTVYTAPYTVMMPFRRLDGTLFEYACHEGNYGLYGILAGARRMERLGRELRP